MISNIIRDVSTSVRKHATLYLIGIGCILNLCIHMINRCIDGIADPIERQLYQNIFLSLLCFLMAAAGLVLIFYCRAVGRAPGPDTLSEVERASRRFLYMRLIPALMMVVIGGAAFVVVNLRW